MSDFQERFVHIAEQAYNTSKSLICRYRDDSIHVVDTLCDDISGLKHARSRLAELEDKSKLQIYFEKMESKFNADLANHTRQFIEDVSETYKSYDKRLRNLFVNEGVSQKQIYDCIDRNNENDYAEFIAKADDAKIDTGVLREVRQEISNGVDKIMRKSDTRRRFFGIVVPLFFVIAIMTLVIINVTGEVDIDRTSIVSIFSSYITSRISQVFGMLNIIILFVMAAAWMIYYKIFNSSMKNKTIFQLEEIMDEIYTKFANRKHEFQDAYSMLLESHLGEINAKYFMKYKPLVETMQMKKGSE